MPRPKFPPLTAGGDLALDEWIRRYAEPAADRKVEVTHTFGATPDVEERIRHALGVKPRSWKVTKQSAAGTIYRENRIRANNAWYVYLKSSVGGLTITLEVS